MIYSILPKLTQCQKWGAVNLAVMAPGDPAAAVVCQYEGVSVQVAGAQLTNLLGSVDPDREHHWGFYMLVTTGPLWQQAQLLGS